MNELKNNYRGVDFERLHVNADDYSRIKTAVVGANGKKKKIKVS